MYSDEIPGTSRPGESAHYRSTVVTEKNDEIESIRTPIEFFTFMSNRIPNNNCLGSREKFENGTFGQYKWLTYAQVRERALRIGSVLRSDRFVQRNEDGEFLLGIYAGTCLNWTQVDLACASRGIISVPIFDTLKTDDVEHIITQTRLRVVAASRANALKLLSLAEAGKIPSLKVVIQLDEPINDKSPFINLGIDLYLLADIENMEVPLQDYSEKSDILTICYTSGTTGLSKGAIITNSNVIESCKHTYFKGHFEHYGVYFSFLPLAHIMERVAIYHLLCCGFAIGYFNGNILMLTEDIVELKPTVFVSVPRLLMRFYDGIKNSFSTMAGIKGKVLKKALQIKWARYKSEGTIHHSFLDTLIFQKTKNLLGGKVKVMATGSAPISSEVMGFLRIVFSSHIFEGYGQTETTSGVFITELKDFTNDHVGGPIEGTIFKIVDVPEMKYLSTDVDPEGALMPRGELYIKGPLVFKGYYKNPEKTAEALDSEGWLKTGDVVKRNPYNGSITIIDRRNNCFKLQQGEFVPAEKIQLYYQKSPFVMQCFVDGDSLQRYPVAVVVPNEEFIRKVWRNEQKIDLSGGIEELCLDKGLKEVILESMEKVAEENGLFGYERVKNIYLEPRPWTPNDLLTPTMKLKRSEAKIKYREIVRSLY